MIDSHFTELRREQHLCCVECERRWVDPSERWRIYLTDDEPAEAVLYCASCASFEFDP
jgi:hypothetical protein